MDSTLNVDTLVKQAAAALKQGNQEQCMAYCNSILSTQPNHVEALYLRGSAQQKTDVHAALLDYDAVLCAQPDHHRAALARGACKNMCGDFVGAIDQPARALPPKHDAEAHQTNPSSPKLIKAARLAPAPTTDGVGNGDDAATSRCKRSHFSIAPLLQAHDALQDAYRAAGDCRDRGDWVGARALYDAVLAQEPHHFRAMFHRAYVNSKVGNHDDAVRDYTTALALQPDSIVARFNRSTVLDAVGRHAEAVADLDAVVRADPDNADAWHNRGVARSHMGDEAGALKDLNTAISINPNHVRALCSRAACHAATPDTLAHAADDYARAIEIQPDPDVCCQRAEVLVKLDRLEDAVKDLTRAVVLDPGHLPALQARAAVLQRLGNEAGAADDLAAAAEQVPDDADVQLMAAHALRGQQRWDAAVAECDRVLTQHPHHVDALSCRAYALRKLHRLQDAADGYAAALAAAGPDADASTILRLYNAHGYCLAMLGDLHSAVATYSAALALDPTNAHALHNRGTTRLQVGDVAGAVCDFEALVKLDPAHAGAQQQLEAALARLHVQ